MAKPKLALIPAAQGDKFYSVLPSSGVGDFDFTRSGGATRINSQGLIETVADGVSRLNYPLIDGKVVGCPSHLLEPSRTNYVNNSNNASLWSSITSGGTITRASNYAISPDGTQNATRLQASVGGSGYALITLAITSAFDGNYTSTVYVKSNTENNQDIVFYGRNTDLAKHTVTKEWTRLQFKGSSTSGQSNYAYIGISTSITAEDNPIDILVWGGQLEQGSFPTSYIKSNGSQTTRSAETANNSGDSSTFNDSEGVLMFEGNSLVNSGGNSSVTISDTSNSLRDSIDLDYRTEDGRLRFIVYSASTVQVNISLYGIDKTNVNKIALTYKENDFQLWFNGIKLSQSQSGSVPTKLSKLKFDTAFNGFPFYGSAKQIQYFDTSLTESELEKLTSWVSFSDMAEGQLYTIE